jgi:hypothetical protein
MLNLALVGLLAGSLVSPAPDGDKDKDRNQATPAPTTEAVPEARVGLVPAVDETADPRTIISQTYAYGRDAEEAPIKMWVEYGRGVVENYYDFDGETQEVVLGGTDGFFVVQNVAVGAQINLLNFPSFKFGLGGQLNISQNKFEADAGAGGAFAGGLESDFGLQGVKVYGQLQGRVLGIHGGYIFDLGSEQTFGAPGVPADLSNSDERNAMNFGVDFDYPSDRIRLFGGAEYFHMEEDEEVINGVPGSTFADGENSNDDILFWTMGLGLRFGFLEIGAALNIRSQLKDGPLNPVIVNNQGVAQVRSSGGHIGSVSPYLKLSPGSLPASLFIRGGVMNEYHDYGYAIGGANEFQPTWGFTAGLTVGFD